MRHAVLNAGAPVILAQATYTSGGVNYSPGTLDAMPRAEKLAIGVYEVVEVLVDNSTGPNVVNAGPVLTLETDHVAATITRRDMTAPELDVAKDIRVNEVSDADIGKAMLSIFRVMYGIAQQISPSITPAQFKTFVDNESDSTDIPATAFRTWLKERIS